MSLEHLQWRYATKKFDNNKKLNDEQLELLLDAIRLTPTSYGMQGFKVLIVENLELRKQLQEASRNQSQVTDASHFLVFCRNNTPIIHQVDSLIERIGTVRKLGKDKLEPYNELIKTTLGNLSQDALYAWLDKQCYIALGFLMDNAALLKIDVCPMEGFDKSAYDTILGLSSKGLASVIAAPIGFRAEDDPYLKLPKMRKCKEELFEKI